MMLRRQLSSLTFCSLQLDYEADVVLPLAEALWRVVLEAAEDVEVQMGYGPFHGARLAVHLLRSLDPAGLAAQQQGQQQGGSSTGSSGEGGSSSARAAASAASASAAAGHLEHLTALLEQYYHPSNTGEGSR
eukprot:XP_001692789.1 predicted protein [Chlamydomonas reinhardtii]